MPLFGMHLRAIFTGCAQEFNLWYQLENYSSKIFALSPSGQWVNIWPGPIFKLSLCSANHRPGYFSNLPCDWPNTAWVYSEQEAENGPWSHNWPICMLRHERHVLIANRTEVVVLTVVDVGHVLSPQTGLQFAESLALGDAAGGILTMRLIEEVGSAPDTVVVTQLLKPPVIRT